MPWKYLASEPFKLRHLIARHWLRDCFTVLEIGGYISPVGPLPGKKYTCIDPKCESFADTFIQGRFEHVSLPYHEGIVILGLELMMPDPGWQKLYDHINHSKVAIVGVALEHIHSTNQFEKIKKSVNKKVTMQVGLDFSGNDFGPSEAPPKTLRKLYRLT